ncbi:ComEC/Rec2 family competence protein [Olivibacter sitiensis]|uniref:ComEC/Rec2 family competence protein n=1 Tax=Olivibacter sitiensis TaxID=376470 RepID=UPI0003FA6FCA|nr:ComEC/Rec2 family competence protein [Olivibacter sitiensis]
MEKERWYKGSIPFVRFLIAYVLGILVAFFVSPTPSCLSIAYAACAALLFAIALCRFFKKWNSKKITLHGLLVFLFLMTVGLLLVWRVQPSVNEMHFSRSSGEELIGYIRSEAIEKNGRMRFDFEVIGVREKRKWIPADGRLLVNVSTDELPASDWGYGEMLVLPQDYRVVEGPKNPNEFNYQRYLSNRQIYHQAFLREEQVLHMDISRGNPIVSLALKWRQKLLEKYRFYIKNETAFNVLSALVLGYRAEIDDHLYQAFSTTGTIHVLSVSGMHVGMVYWLLAFLLGWMKGSRSIRWFRYVLIVLAIWAYCVLTGMAPSTLRAAVMISFVVTAQSFSRQHQAFNTIAASAFVLLLFNPLFLLDVGFQLSYLAVFGIAWLYQVLNRWMPVANWVLRQARDACSISLSAQLFATPLSMFYFHLFPNYFLLGNLFIGLPATLMVYGGILVHFLPYGKAAYALSHILERLTLCTMDGLSFLSKLPFASISGVWLSVWQTLLWYCLIVFTLWAFFHRQKSAFIATLVSFIVLAFSQLLTYFEHHGHARLVFHQVNQSWAISYADGMKALCLSNLDGPTNSQFRYSVQPFLDRFHCAEKKFMPDEHKSYLFRMGDWHILVLEKNVSIEDIPDNIDFVLLRGNAIVDLQALSNSLSHITLIVDGSNKTETVQEAQSLAIKRQWKFYPLKDSYAYISE